MATTPTTGISQKEQVEHTARSALPPRARKKETAKQSRSTDQIRRAPKKLALTEAEERSILNDPLASKAAAPQNSETALYTGSGFPPPGLAFYAAQAMSLAVQTDANAMDVYSNLEQDEYKMINLAYQRMADSDRSSIMSQASATMWGAISSMAMGGLTFGGGALGVYKIGNLTTETNDLNTERNDLNLQLGKVADFGKADEASITQELNEAKAGGKGSIATRLRNASDKFDRSIKFQDDLKNFHTADESSNQGEWETAVDNRFSNEQQDGFLDNLDEEQTAFNNRITDHNLANPENQISNADRAMLNQPFNERRVALTGARDDLKANGFGADTDTYDNQKGVLTEEFKATKSQLTEDKAEVKRGIEKVDAKLKTKKLEGSKIQSYISMATGLGQFAQVFQFGKMDAEMGQATYQYQKNKAQQAQTMNEAIRGEVARQWSSLAQAAEGAFQEYASTIKAINQSLRV